jgi:hypothetical protein
MLNFAFSFYIYFKFCSNTMYGGNDQMASVTGERLPAEMYIYFILLVVQACWDRVRCQCAGTPGLWRHASASQAVRISSADVRFGHAYIYIHIHIHMF